MEEKNYAKEGTLIKMGVDFKDDEVVDREAFSIEICLLIKGRKPEYWSQCFAIDDIRARCGDPGFIQAIKDYVHSTLMAASQYKPKDESCQTNK